MSRRWMVLASAALCVPAVAGLLHHVLGVGSPSRQSQSVEPLPPPTRGPPSADEDELRRQSSRMDDLNARLLRAEKAMETARTVDESTATQAPVAGPMEAAAEGERQANANIATLDGRMRFESVDAAWATIMTEDLDSGIEEMFPDTAAAGITRRSVVCSTSFCRVVIGFANGALRHAAFQALSRLRPFRDKYTMVHADPNSADTWIYAARPNLPLPLDFGRPLPRDVSR